MTRRQIVSWASGVVSLPLLTWAGVQAAETVKQAAKVPQLEAQQDKTYNKVEKIDERMVELLSLVYGAVGDLRKEIEMRKELDRLREEARARRKARESEEQSK